MDTRALEQPTAPQPSRWSAWLSPARIAAIAVLGSIPVRMLAERLADPDLWWHLQTGALIASSRSIPRSDPYSFTRPGDEWVVQEWGSELILHGLREAFGLWGIWAFRAVLLFAIYALVARILVRRMGSGIGTWALLGLTAYGGSTNWTERPNLLSFLLFVVTLDLLDHRDKRIWWFVPLAAVWANLHGMVILGVGLVALVAVAEAIKVWWRWDGADAARTRTLGIVAVAGLAATMLNPVGPRLLGHAFGLLSAVRGIVTEWGSPDFHDPGAMVFLLLVLITFLAAAFGPSRPDLTDVALVCAFLVLGLQAARNLAVAAIVLGITASRWLPSAIERLQPPRPPRREVGGGSSVVLGVFGLTILLLGFAVVLIDGAPRSGRFADIVEETYPVAAIDMLDRPGTRAFVYDGWSGLVIDRAWPNAKVYIDLRTDFYGRELMNRYRRTIAARPDWRTNLDGACITHVLIAPEEALAQVLAGEAAWRTVTADETAVLFARATPAPGCPK